MTEARFYRYGAKREKRNAESVKKAMANVLATCLHACLQGALALPAVQGGSSGCCAGDSDSGPARVIRGVGLVERPGGWGSLEGLVLGSIHTPEQY